MQDAEKRNDQFKVSSMTDAEWIEYVKKQLTLKSSKYHRFEKIGLWIILVNNILQTLVFTELEYDIFDNIEFYHLYWDVSLIVIFFFQTTIMIL